MMSGCIGHPKPPEPRRRDAEGIEVTCAHCQCRTIGAGGAPWMFDCAACGEPVCDDCEQSGGCPGKVVLETQSVTHHFTCKPCPGCGDPHYVDGCLRCGHGIDGRDLSGGGYA